MGKIKRYVEMKQLQGHGYIFGDSGHTISHLHIPFTLIHIRPMQVLTFGEAFIVGVVHADSPTN